jgi:short subunit dehydrogenase-like uncharacterized protein
MQGPQEEKRKRASAIFVGEATAQSRGRVLSKLITPEGYTCTALTTVAIMKRILNDEYIIGFQTPSLAYGADFIMQFDGVRREDLV